MGCIGATCRPLPDLVLVCLVCGKTGLLCIRGSCHGRERGRRGGARASRVWKGEHVYVRDWANALSHNLYIQMALLDKNGNVHKVVGHTVPTHPEVVLS